MTENPGGKILNHSPKGPNKRSQLTELGRSISEKVYGGRGGGARQLCCVSSRGVGRGGVMGTFPPLGP